MKNDPSFDEFDCFNPVWKMRTTKEGSMTVVFGSNCQGIHGKGMALFAKQYLGAMQGCGEGLQGQCYALPTREFKNGSISTRTLQDIDLSVRTFLATAEQNPERVFQLTPVGTGLAGHTQESMRELFKEAPANVKFPAVWLERPKVLVMGDLPASFAEIKHLLRIEVMSLIKEGRCKDKSGIEIVTRKKGLVDEVVADVCKDVGLSLTVIDEDHNKTDERARIESHASLLFWYCNRAILVGEQRNCSALMQSVSGLLGANDIKHRWTSSLTLSAEELALTRPKSKEIRQSVKQAENEREVISDVARANLGAARSVLESVLKPASKTASAQNSDDPFSSNSRSLTEEAVAKAAQIEEVKTEPAKEKPAISPIKVRPNVPPVLFDEDPFSIDGKPTPSSLAGQTNPFSMDS